MNNPVIVCEKLCKSVKQGKSTYTILSQIDLCLSAKTGAVIMGASGSGKSTLLNILGGLDYPTSGRVQIQGRWLDTLNEKQLAKMRNLEIGFIHQFHHLLENFNAIENVAMPLLLRGLSKRIAYQKSQILLEEVGLGHRNHDRCALFSGGERQRIAFARALVTRPALILADEPTGSLDGENARNTFSLLQKLIQEHEVACLLVTHDPHLAAQWDVRYQMIRGQLFPQAR